MAASATAVGMPGAAGTVDSGMGMTGTFKKPMHHESFRSNNVKFLQEQNRDCTIALDKLETERDEAIASVDRWEQRREELQNEFNKLQGQLLDTEERCNISAAEIHKRDEQIRVLSEQNRSLLDMLETEEKTVREREANVHDLSGKQEKLQKISDQYDVIKETGNQQLTGAYTEIAKFEEELRSAQSETSQLKEAEVNFREQAKIDVEALEQKLAEAKETNVKHLQQIQHNEVHEHRLNEGIQRLRETLDELTVQKKGIRMQLEMDSENRDKWMQSKSEVNRRKENLDNMVEALRQSLRAAEQHNSKILEDNKVGADNFRQLGDKVYALMDQLRQHQMELKKQETAGLEKTKKVAALDKQSQHLQQSLQMEVDAKLAAEAEARNAAQMQALLQKKNKMLEEALNLALKAQEKVEKRLQELTDKANALKTQNDYLGTRIDGNEEDKGALKYEQRRSEDELRQATASNTQLTNQQSEAEDKFNEVEAEKAALLAELQYVKREDMLDESGRTKPILIESESKLIERLQVNEFLYSAQQARNPVPMLVEKVSHILEMLHTSQTQADLYLQDLQRSNSMLTALRHKNMALYERVQMCETWKMRALLKIASNEFEMRQSVKGHLKAKDQHCLYLDGLQYSNKELEELVKVITNYMKQDYVKEIHLQDNQLDRTSVPLLTQLLELCPYLLKLDLKANRLDEGAVNDIKSYVERIPGITSVMLDPATGDIKAKSGRVERLVVVLQDQQPPDPNSDANGSSAADMFGEDPSGTAADAFLSSGAGITGQRKLQGPAAQGGPAGGAGNARNTMVPQKGMGESKSEGLLPKIGSGRR